jgi:hypothetical protein
VSRFIAGQSVRKISREEKRDRETIARILRSNEVQLYIQDLRKSYIGLGPEAINALRKRLRSCKDGLLAHRLLSDIGVVPSARERDLLLSGDSESGNPALDLLKKLADSIAEDDQNDEEDVTPK